MLDANKEPRVWLCRSSGRDSAAIESSNPAPGALDHVSPGLTLRRCYLALIATEFNVPAEVVHISVDLVPYLIERMK
jgi:hypothetical protein